MIIRFFPFLSRLTPRSFMANNTVLMCLLRLCVHTFVTLSKCRINGKWVIANRSSEEKETAFSRYSSTSRIDKKCLSAFAIDNIMTTARKSNIRQRKDTRDEKSKESRKKSKYCSDFIFSKSRKCCDCHFENLPWRKVWKLHMKKLPANSESRPKMHVARQFRTFITSPPYNFVVDVVWLAINWEGISVRLAFVLINSKNLTATAAWAKNKKTKQIGNWGTEKRNHTSPWTD